MFSITIGSKLPVISSLGQTRQRKYTTMFKLQSKARIIKGPYWGENWVSSLGTQTFYVFRLCKDGMN